MFGKKRHLKVFGKKYFQEISLAWKEAAVAAIAVVDAVAAVAAIAAVTFVAAIAAVAAVAVVAAVAAITAVDSAASRHLASKASNYFKPSFLLNAENAPISSPLQF